jgi:SMC interacting uncharacterized protein involved in chromosome segregation
MRCMDLKVVSLNITEDNYEYKALFRLCNDSTCIDLDLSRFSETETLEEIKKSFSIDESIDEMKSIIMQKVMEATKIESRITEGQNCCEDVKDKKLQRSIDSLNMS